MRQSSKEASQPFIGQQFGNPAASGGRAAVAPGVVVEPEPALLPLPLCVELLPLGVPLPTVGPELEPLGEPATRSRTWLVLASQHFIWLPDAPGEGVV